MIDLHMHTINSDGDKTPLEILKLCEDNKLSYISITDHDNCQSYNDIKSLDVKKYYSGNIIYGAEMTTSFENTVIEILGYGVDKDIVNEFHKKQYSLERLTEIENYQFNKLLGICKKLGLKNTKDLKLDIIKRGFSNRIVYNDLMKYEQNLDILGEELMQTFSIFYRNGIANPKHKLFSEEYKLHPTVKEVVELIKASNGLCFLAHLYVYDVEDHIAFLDRLREEVKLDGLECYYSRFTESQTNQIVQYAKTNNLYMSGGCDYHGKSKPDLHIGIGLGNLKIHEEILKPWIHKVKMYN